MVLHLNLQKQGIGLANPIRETDTASAAANVVPLRNAVPPAALSADVGALRTQARPNVPARSQRRSSGIPSFKNNPLGAVGLILSNIAAGMRGQELPTTKIRKEQLVQRQLELRELGALFDLVGQGVKLFGGADLDNPEIARTFEGFTSRVRQSLPEFDGILRAAIDIRKATGSAAIENAGDYADFMQRRCGGRDAQCVKKAFLDPKVMAQADEEIDRENIPLIIKTFNAMAEGLRTNPAGQQAFTKIAENGITIDEIPELNDVLPEGFKFSQSQINTIFRSEDAQNALIGVGFKPSSLVLKAAEAEITEAAKARHRVSDRNLTPKQRSTNSGIESARAFWRETLTKNYGGDARKMMDAVFQLNPITKAFEPRDKALGDLWTKARNVKVGGDPDFENFMRLFLPPAPEAIAPPPPAAGAEGPGLFERGANFVGELFGGDDAGAAAAQAGSPPAVFNPENPPPSPRIAGGQVQGQSLSALPRTPDGAIDPSAMVPNVVYTDDDGSRWFWDGAKFTKIR